MTSRKGMMKVRPLHIQPWKPSTVNVICTPILVVPTPPNARNLHKNDSIHWTTDEKLSSSRLYVYHTQDNRKPGIQCQSTTVLRSFVEADSGQSKTSFTTFELHTSFKHYIGERIHEKISKKTRGRTIPGRNWLTCPY